MNYSHKLSLTALFALLVSLFALAGCRGDSGNKPTPPAEPQLAFTVNLPDAFTVEGIKGSFAYYWDKDYVLSYELSQGAKKLTGNLSPKRVWSDGAAADFVIPIPKESGLGEGSDLTFKAVLKPSEELSEDVRTVVSSDKIGGTLPFDLLGAVPMTFDVGSTFVYNDHATPALSFDATPRESVLVVQILNKSEETRTPTSLKLMPEAGEALTFSFAENEKSLSPDFYKNYLIRLPKSPKELGSVKAELGYAKGDATEHFSFVSAVAFRISDNRLPLVLSLDKKGLSLSNAPFVEKADTSKGGDPLFTMNDITYWVGEGSNRAALVIDFHLTEGEDAYVWGYRFDGEKSGADMFMDIVKADPRLSYVGLYGAYGLSISAIAYQAGEKVSNPKPAFLLNGSKLKNDGKGFTEITDYDIIDLLKFEDETALLRTGWKKIGYWSYHTKDTRLDPFHYSQIGVTGRTLTDGSWDALSFQIGWEQWEGNPPSKKFRPAPAPKE